MVRPTYSALNSNVSVLVLTTMRPRPKRLAIGGEEHGPIGGFAGFEAGLHESHGAGGRGGPQPGGTGHQRGLSALLVAVGGAHLIGSIERGLVLGDQLENVRAAAFLGEQQDHGLGRGSSQDGAIGADERKILRGARRRGPAIRWPRWPE